MNDKVFGEMIFRFGWIKTESIQLWNKTCEVRVRTSSKKDEFPTEAQQAAYIRYKQEILNLLNNAQCQVKTFICSYEEEINDSLGKFDEDNALDYISLKEVLFFKNGKYALLFDTQWSESGMAILCSADKYEIGESYIVEFEQ